MGPTIHETRFRDTARERNERLRARLREIARHTTPAPEVQAWAKLERERAIAAALRDVEEPAKSTIATVEARIAERIRNGVPGDKVWTESLATALAKDYKDRDTLARLANYSTAASRHYHRWRCHQGLDMDCPEPRPVQSPEQGEVVEVAEAGGMYRHYERRAA